MDALVDSSSAIDSIHVELRTSTRGQQLLRELGCALLVGDVVARDGEPRLRASDIGVREHDLGRHRHQGEAAKGSLTREVGARRRNGGATRAEDIHFPTCVHAGIEQVHVRRSGRRRFETGCVRMRRSLRRVANSRPLAHAAWRAPASPAPSLDGRRGFDRAPARRAMSGARPRTSSTTRRRAALSRVRCPRVSKAAAGGRCDRLDVRASHAAGGGRDQHSADGGMRPADHDRDLTFGRRVDRAPPAALERRWRDAAPMVRARAPDAGRPRRTRA